MLRPGAPPPAMLAAGSGQLTSIGSTSSLPTRYAADGHPALSFAAVRGNASQRTDTVSPQPSLQRVATAGSLPAAQLGVPSPVVVRQPATSPLPHLLQVASGSANAAAAVPESARGRQPARVPSTTALAPPRTVQRCYSAGCLQQQPQTMQAPQVPGTAGGNPQVARFYSGVIRNQSTPNTTSPRQFPNNDSNSAPCGGATPSHPNQKVVVFTNNDAASLQGRQPQGGIVRMNSASSLARPPNAGPSLDIARWQELGMTEDSPKAQSGSKAAKSADGLTSRSTSRATTPTAGRQLPQGPAAVGRMHSKVTKTLEVRKGIELRKYSQDTTPRPPSSHEETEVTPTSSTHRSPSSRRAGSRGDSGGTGEDTEREVDTTWEVPYAVRAGSPPPRSSTGGAVSPAFRERPRSVDDKEGKRSESQRRRFQGLYEDHEMRQKKWLKRFEEKQRREEAEQRRKLGHTCQPRPFNEEEFKNWYCDSMNKKQEFLANTEEKQRSEARLRTFQELSKCTFTPSAPTVKAARPPPSFNSSQKSPERSLGGSIASSEGPRPNYVEQDSQQATADELVAAQVVQIDALRQLDMKEKDLRENGQREFADQLEKSLEEGRRKLKLFGETPEGREYLASRAQSYMELNRGMSHEAAMLEARNDLARASEVRLQKESTLMLQQRANSDAQQIQLGRLKVIWELIQLQRRYTQLLEKQTVPRSMLQGFDSKLVDRLTKEAWYIEARSSAKGMAKAEGAASMPSEAASH